ncbi:hypothetical protein PoB_002493900 [Plakobranchus ocellatus]|uniref:Uncharacterized protein n=1 Tax=Plakobranchus ocellatus TaxID=259542 RepID=A0AAV3ZVI0_9GAST|nr:hypothetical protein PoB_002493900 [Plakobranchus ocellatus]
MFLGLGFDILAIIAGLLYFLSKGKARTNLWKRSIPTVGSGLLAAGLILLACLIFVVDLEDVTATEVQAYVDERCTTNLANIKLAPKTGFSLYLALASGGFLLIKSAVFGALVSCF